jgi:outer membrane protein insertion porin family
MPTSRQTLIAFIGVLGLAGGTAAQTWTDEASLTEEIATTLAATAQDETAPLEDSPDFAFPEGLIEDGVEAADPVGRLRAGLVYNDTLGPSLLFGISHQAPFGRDVQLDFSAKIASKGREGRLQLRRDGVFDSAWDGYLDLRALSRDAFDSYTTQDLVTDIGLIRDFGQVTGRVALRYRSSEITEVSAGTSTLITPDDVTTTSVVGALSYANRSAFGSGDLIFRAKGELERGNRYGRTTAQARWTYLPARPIALTFGLKGGRVSGDDLLVSERFLGGAALMRGFEYRGIGPRDLSAANRDALGGETFTAASLQVDTSLARFGAENWTVGAFIDWGTIWGLDAAGSVDDSKYRRSAAGLSIGYQLEDLRLQIDLSEGLSSEAYDVTESLRISLSARF